MMTSNLKVIEQINEPWIGPDGQVLNDLQLRLVSRNWDSETWERYLSTLESSLIEVQISPKKFDSMAAHRRFEATGSKREKSKNPSSLKLQKALDQLTFKQREIIELIFFKLKSSRQASEILGISQSSVRDLKRKALRNLRKLLLGGTLTLPIVRGEVNQKEDSNV